MAENTQTETRDAEDETEPATRHDVAEGGILGAIGGAIVGGLAGGPLGAVIGAIAGGAASAGAVDVVDKLDHDYSGTTDDAAALPLAETVAPESFIDLPAPAMATETPAPRHTDLQPLIRERAYEIYDQRGRGDDRDVEDWLIAEREVLLE